MSVTEACEMGYCGSCYKGQDQSGGWCQCVCHPVVRRYHWWRFDRRDPLWIGFRTVAEPVIILPTLVVAVILIVVLVIL